MTPRRDISSGNSTLEPPARLQGPYITRKKASGGVCSCLALYHDIAGA